MADEEVKKAISLLEMGEPAPEDHDPNKELQFDFGIRDGMVIVDFGKAVRWIGLPPDDALQFVQHMARVAKQVLAGETKARPS
jgi:hypothetical protein